MGRVTEKKRIKIDHSCVSLPVYLSWLGISGGRNYWLFKLRQAYGVNTQSRGEFSPYTPDIENAQGTVFSTGIEVNPRLTVGAVVDLEDAEGIETILYSNDVLRLMNPDTWQSVGPVWQVVRVVPGSFKLWDTDQSRVELEFSINLEPINTQST